MWRWKLLLAFAEAVCAAGALPAAARAAEHVSLTSGFGGRAGIRCCRPGAWGIVSANVCNADDRPARALVSMYFANDPSLQYARQLWVPARAMRFSWCPILPPRSISPGSFSVEVKSLLYDRSQATENLLTSPFELRMQSRLLRIDHSRLVTGMIVDANWGDRVVGGGEWAAYLVGVARVTEGLSPRVSELLGEFFPPVPESLRGLDHLVLASDRLASDAAGLAAVRSWLYGGGRLWVMLDRTSPATVELLLGNAFRCRVVDRVGLTRVLVKDVTPEAADDGDQAREFDEPVDLVRVVTTGVRVHHTVNGWPASFWQRVGRGRVLFTTLGPHGWLRAHASGDPVPAGRHDLPPVAATTPLECLAAEFFGPREPPMLDSQQFAPYLAEQIGYRIASRKAVITVLGAFCLALVAGGAWLAGKNRLERMAWVGPLAAGLSALALVVMGLRATRTVPPTVAVAQLVEAEPQSDSVEVTGLLAVYNQQECGDPVGARHGGIFRPDMTGLGGTTRRVVRTDLDQWHWENLTLPAGVRTAAFEYAGPIEGPIEARATFGPAGLTGTLTCPSFEDPADAVIATGLRGNLAVSLDEGGAFRAGSDDVLAPGQFINGGILSDEKRRRQTVYQQALPAEAGGAYPERPMLLAWTKPLDMGFALRPEARRVGSALLAVPLALEPTPPGTRVVVPSPLVDYRKVRDPLGGDSGSYSNSRREWLTLRSASNPCLRFQIPTEVLPMRLEQATLTVQIVAPSRSVQIVGWAGQSPVPLATWSSPIGVRRVQTDRDDVLQLDDRGGLLLSLRVGQHGTSPAKEGASVMGDPAWKIEAVRLEVTGQTLPPAQGSEIAMKSSG